MKKIHYIFLIVALGVAFILLIRLATRLLRLEILYRKFFTRLQALDRTIQERSKEFSSWRRETSADLFEFYTQTQYAQENLQHDVARINQAMAELYEDKIPPTKIVEISRKEN